MHGQVSGLCSGRYHADRRYRSAEEQASNEDAADAEKPVINWSWGTTLSDKTEPSVVAMQDMADELKEKTNGRFTLTLYIGASLGSESGDDGHAPYQYINDAGNQYYKPADL